MHFEIERKFLVINNDFLKEVFNSKRIVQGYICKEKQHTVRVRVSNDEAFLTIKGQSSEDGLSRLEWEKQISLDDAKILETLCIDPVIKKVRHLIRTGEYIFEVDVFEGTNSGLIMAEIELPHKDASFIRPHWLGEEVTGDSRYYNSYLSSHPYSQW